eukprot:3726847-Ditylum_brightwellii.AAC.1
MHLLSTKAIGLLYPSSFGSVDGYCSNLCVIASLSSMMNSPRRSALRVVDQGHPCDVDGLITCL